MVLIATSATKRSSCAFSSIHANFRLRFYQYRHHLVCDITCLQILYNLTTSYDVVTTRCCHRRKKSRSAKITRPFLNGNNFTAAVSVCWRCAFVFALRWKSENADILNKPTTLKHEQHLTSFVYAWMCASNLFAALSPRTQSYLYIFTFSILFRFSSHISSIFKKHHVLSAILCIF
jgi:hypothetical protein